MQKEMSSSTVPFFKRPSTKTLNARKRVTRPPSSDSDKSDFSSSSSDGEATTSSNSSTAMSVLTAKKRKRIGGISDTILTSSTGKKVDIGAVEHQGTRSATVTNSTDVFKKSAMFDDENKDSKVKDQANSEVKDGVYTGTANYKKFTQQREGVKKKIGPLKASSSIRSSTVVDYQPDVCKDYKLTGFCGYGDSCKFLHMRENYKAGWQLDKEWEEVQKKKTRS
ncbi:hypothetical protein V1514DRAFT_324459 [Lipomyces japonicus]|uniref:uncharacterized protein n=1 Tax=Lipomyces japonicus TaxID=56871 RepID=UPI0034CD4C0C